MEAAVTTVPEFPPRLSLLQAYRMYSIWEVRHEILFEMLKSPISRHSTTFRDDKLPAGCKGESVSQLLKEQTMTGLQSVKDESLGRAAHAHSVRK